MKDIIQEKSNKIWNKKGKHTHNELDQIVKTIYESGKKAGIEEKLQEVYQKDILEMIEEEIELATGVKSEIHHSGDCRMNDIMWKIQEQIRTYEEKLIVDIKSRLDNSEGYYDAVITILNSRLNK